MRYHAVTGGLKHDWRATLHYHLVFVVMGAYGLWVCPMVKNLPVVEWLLHMGILLVLVRGLRMFFIHPILRRVESEWQVLAQFLMDLFLMGMAGFALSFHHQGWYGTGLRGTIELTIGFFIFGFFIGTDLALIHNRRLALKIGRECFTTTGHFVSAPRKLIVMTVASLLSVMVMLFFVFTNELQWLVELGPDGMMAAERSILVNIGFIFLVLMVLTGNLIITYAQNIQLFLKAETRTLAEVAGGNFDSRVPVAFNNELGVIASYTNRMIAGLKEQNMMVERLRDVIINSMASLAETRDNETGAHIRRTQHYVKLLAETLAALPKYREELDVSAIDLLYKTAPLHDIGKVGVPDAILLKPGRLTADEYDTMKRHTLSGEEAIRRAEFQMGPGADITFLHCARQIAGGHHEKWDGSGYPRGLAGEAIPLPARLMALADVYDALRSRRVYKGACSHGEARDIILEGRGTHFDPDVVDAFIACEQRFVEISRCFEDRERVTDKGEESLVCVA